jgi:hypothetical protein
MERINGVTFEDWACACANITAGMSLEEACRILEIDELQWEHTNMLWGKKLGDLMTEDMGAATKFAEIFTNPKAGRFTHVESHVKSLEDVLKLVPDYNTYQKIFWHQSVAFAHGDSANEVIMSYGLDLLKWSQLANHYSEWYRGYVVPQQQQQCLSNETYNTRFHETNQISNYWKKHFEEHYKGLAPD